MGTSQYVYNLRLIDIKKEYWRIKLMLIKIYEISDEIQWMENINK